MVLSRVWNKTANGGELWVFDNGRSFRMDVQIIQVHAQNVGKRSQQCEMNITSHMFESKRTGDVGDCFCTTAEERPYKEFGRIGGG